MLPQSRLAWSLHEEYRLSEAVDYEIPDLDLQKFLRSVASPLPLPKSDRGWTRKMVDAKSLKCRTLERRLRQPEEKRILNKKQRSCDRVQSHFEPRRVDCPPEPFSWVRPMGTPMCGDLNCIHSERRKWDSGDQVEADALRRGLRHDVSDLEAVEESCAFGVD